MKLCTDGVGDLRRDGRKGQNVKEGTVFSSDVKKKVNRYSEMFNWMIQLCSPAKTLNLIFKRSI